MRGWGGLLISLKTSKHCDLYLLYIYYLIIKYGPIFILYTTNNIRCKVERQTSSQFVIKVLVCLVFIKACLIGVIINSVQSTIQSTELFCFAAHCIITDQVTYELLIMKGCCSPLIPAKLGNSWTLICSPLPPDYVIWSNSRSVDNH